MPRQLKPYVKVGTRDWEVDVPRPPKFATHARMTIQGEFKENGQPKVATLPIRDFGCFKGVRGDFSYLRMNKQLKVLEEHKEQWHWDGKQVEGLEIDE